MKGEGVGRRNRVKKLAKNGETRPIQTIREGKREKGQRRL